MAPGRWILTTKKILQRFFPLLLKRLVKQLSLVQCLAIERYSKDLKLKVLAAVDRGLPKKEVVRTFVASLATIKRYLKRRGETGEVARAVL